MPGLTVVLAMPTLNLAHQLMAKVATSGMVTVRGGQIVVQIALTMATMATMATGATASTDGSGGN